MPINAHVVKLLGAIVAVAAIVTGLFLRAVVASALARCW